MKREISFRGKSKSTGEWVFGNLFDKDTKGRTHIGTTVRMCFDIDPETVGQFTGMTDKNGTKIFEGDIVNHTRRTSNGIESTNAEVYFDTEMLEFGLKELNELFHVQFYDEFEVIGSIHDNPELLK